MRPGRGGAGGLLVKLGLLAAVDALALAGLGPMVQRRAWLGLAAVVAATVTINWVYLSRRRVPAKYLLPGTVFLLAFQVYPVLYNGYIAFTNYGTGHILTKDQAIEQIARASVYTPEGAVRYRAETFAGAGGVALLLTDPGGAVFLGTAAGLAPVEEGDAAVTVAGGRVVAVGGYRRVSLREAQDRQADFQALRVPVAEGDVRLTTFREAVRREHRLRHDAARDVFVDRSDGTVYRADARRGAFAAGGTALTPGWRVTVGPANFARVLSSPAIRGPFLRVLVWTYVFATLSVATTFALGLALAVVLNHPGLRLRTLYRSLVIAPYALPSFMTALVWAGLLNRQFGVVNQLLGAAVPWLTDPTMAKVSILLVNLWLGFPYMFLVTTGALQSIPPELGEAASVDGASGFQTFRKITFPLLLVGVAPVLIASFAFNFNNFNVIYLLTGGRPPIAGAATPAGHTDILISYTYRLAFESGTGQDFGFAAAVSVIIFALVAVIAIAGFRLTRSLEETY